MSWLAAQKPVRKPLQGHAQRSAAPAHRLATPDKATACAGWQHGSSMCYYNSGTLETLACQWHLRRARTCVAALVHLGHHGRADGLQLLLPAPAVRAAQTTGQTAKYSCGLGSHRAPKGVNTV